MPSQTPEGALPPLNSIETNDPAIAFITRAGIKLQPHEMPGPGMVIDAKDILEQRGEAIAEEERAVIRNALLSIDVV